jgi:hypothetical protein
MKKILFIIFACLLIVPNIVLADKSLPMSFYGRAELNGNSLPAGSIVQVFAAGILAGQSTVDDNGYYGKDNPDQPGLSIASYTGNELVFKYIEGGESYAGATVVKYSEIFEAGKTIELDLPFINIADISVTPNSSGDGSSVPVVATTTKPAAGGQVFGVKIYPIGSLLRTPNKRIYVIVSTSTVKYISSLKELFTYRGRTIYNVSYEVLAQYKQVLGIKIYPDGTLLRGPDLKIYVILNGKKNYISSLKELWKYRNHKLYNVRADVIASY